MNKLSVDTLQAPTPIKAGHTLIYQFEKNSQVTDDLILFDPEINTVIIKVEANSRIQLFEKVKTERHISYRYELAEQAMLSVSRCNNNIKVVEKNEAHLNGEHSIFELKVATISKTQQTYQFDIFHHAKQTTSTIVNHGVTFDHGSLELNVNGTIDKGSIKTSLNQESKVIVFGDGITDIRPNLYIDEEDVEARHSAVIGGFGEEELFYLQSRGLTKHQAEELLLTGFLQGNLDPKIRSEMEVKQ